MLFGIEWYWWIVILVVLGISIPLKVNFLKRWDGRRRKKREDQPGKWGEDE